MKNVLILAAVVLAALTSCSGPSSTELKASNDSLLLALAEKDQAQNDLINGLIEINDNLSQIKEKENIISMNASEASGNNQIKDQINQDIKLIYDLMVQNQEKIADLEKQLRSTNRDNANMRKLIESLNQQIKEKNEEIVRLTEELASKNIQIDQLSSTLGTTRQSLDSLGTENTKTKSELAETTIELNSGFYIIGSAKELKEKSVVDAQGLFNSKKIVLSKNVDKSIFTKVDIRETEEISIDKKKAKVKLMTNHPSSSYTVRTNADGTSTIVISDQKSFWSVSKYLVIQLS